MEERDKLTRQINGAGQRRTVTLINKSGVYSLILDSQMPKAKEYRHWVTSEILPQVDEKGYFSVTESVQPVVESPPQRQQILLLAANLLLDKNIF